MPLAYPRFFSSPLGYARYHAHQNPALFWSVFIGAFSPIFLIVVPKVRSAMGYELAPRIPLTYPIPPGPRKSLGGYDDDA